MKFTKKNIRSAGFTEIILLISISFLSLNARKNYEITVNFGICIEKCTFYFRISGHRGQVTQCTARWEPVSAQMTPHVYDTIHVLYQGEFTLRLFTMPLVTEARKFRHNTKTQENVGYQIKGKNDIAHPMYLHFWIS